MLDLHRPDETPTLATVGALSPVERHTSHVEQLGFDGAVTLSQPQVDPQGVVIDALKDESFEP